MKRLRFGIFDFAPETQELRREGIAVRLQAQPAQVLGYLVSHAGQVVSRTELRERVWSDGTIVDFDQGLNFCVAQIRAAIGDTADSPRFIKTLPKRGYQFIAPVEVVGEEPAASLFETRLETRRKFPLRWVWLGVGLAVVAGAVWVARSLLRHNVRVEPTTIAITRFDNETGSDDMTRFADGLTDTVVAELTNAGKDRLSVIGNAAALRLPRNQRNIQSIGISLGANYIVLGQVQRSEAHVRVLAHLIHLPDQKHVRVSRAEFDLTEPLRQQSEIAHRIVAEFMPLVSGAGASKP